MKIKLIVTHNQMPIDISDLCEDNIKVVTERVGSPSKLTFTVIRKATKDKFAFSEGDNVRLWVNDYPMFNGFIFTKKREQEQNIEVTAYDQLRYLNNSDTYIYNHKKASDVLKIIADDFNLTLGDVEDTRYVISYREEDNSSLFDIILNAVDITLINTKKLYVLYDDFGKLCLKNIHNMRLPFLMVTDDGTVTNFTYKTDIDSDTYNRIKYYKDNNDTGKREIYIAEHSGNQKKWGVLQKYESVPDGYNEAQIINLVNKILEQKNRVKKSLTVECIGMDNGETAIRGGSEIFVKIDNCGENNINNWFIVDKCTHTFGNNIHQIKIELLDF